MKRKRMLALSLCAVLLLSFTGCGARSSQTPVASAAPAAGDWYPPAKPAGENSFQEFNTEEYNAIQENGFRPVSRAPLSTFSADVDTASYSNLRRMLLDEGRVQPDAVRIEEMINYFHYDYPQPVDEHPFSITTELSRCPWNDQTMLLLIGLQAKQIDKEEITG